MPTDGSYVVALLCSKILFLNWGFIDLTVLKDVF